MQRRKSCIHRNTVLWSQIFKIYYALLIFVLIPIIPDFVDISYSLPLHVFRISGILMSFVFLYVSLSYSKRLEASTKTYNTLLEKLPDNYKRCSINQLKFGKLFKFRTSYIVVVLLFISLLIIDIVLWIIGK